MTLSVTLTEEQERRLRERAEASGQDLSTYVATLIGRIAGPHAKLEELSGQAYQAFLESGLTDDQLGDMVEKAKHEMRAERRTRSRG